MYNTQIMFKKIAILAVSIVSITFILFIGFTGFTRVDASEIIVYQPFSGKMEIWSDPGWKFSAFGKPTTYLKSDEFEFSATLDDRGEEITTRCTKTRFNDKGSASICGQASFDLPTDHKQMLVLHEKFRSMDGIKDRLVKTAITKGIYNSGALMSSKESAGQRRSELISFIQDQAIFGVFKTEQTQTEEDDFNAPPLEIVEMQAVPSLDEGGIPKLTPDGKPVYEQKPIMVKKIRKKTVTIIKPRLDSNGKFEVQEESAATIFGLRLYNITVDKIVYEDSVQAQINEQRNLEMQIQTSIAKAETAKQDVITVEQSGKADAQRAKWEQEVKKAKAITEAEQKREVAKLALEEERLKAEAVLVKAEAEAQAKDKLIKADGALDKKLDAWKYGMDRISEAVGKHRQVPDIQIGSNGNSADSTALMLQTIGVQAAKQLQLNMKIDK